MWARGPCIMKKNIEFLFLGKSFTIRQVMETITEAPHRGLPSGIVLVVDDQKKLIGSVTDGDIRKALVKGASMDDSIEKIMIRDPITVDEDLTADEKIRSMMTKVKASGRIHGGKVDQVIVTDKKNRVVDVLDFYELWYKQEVRYKRICVVGAGHVGLTLSVVLADLGYQVLGFDINPRLVASLNKGEVGFYEKGLEPLLRFHIREKNIKFISALYEGIADIYIICVGTPVHEETNQPLNDAIKKAAGDVGKVLQK